MSCCCCTSFKLRVTPHRQTQSLSSQHTPSLAFQAIHKASPSQLKAVLTLLFQRLPLQYRSAGHDSDPTEVSRKYPAGFLNAMHDFSELRAGKYRTDISGVCLSSTVGAHAAAPSNSASWMHAWKQLWPDGCFREQLAWLLISTLL